VFEFFARLLAPDFMPHGHCYMWTPSVLWLNVGSDAAIALAYFSIPLALLSVVRQRKDLDYPWLLLLFASFIVSCGITHLVAIMTTWNGAYRLEGLVKLITAVVSLVTAIALWPLVPKLVSLPSPGKLEDLNARLQRRIDHLELMEEVAGVGYWRVDTVANEVQWSREIYRIHGLDPETFTPDLDNAVEAYHPEDRPVIAAELQRAMKERSSFSCELRILHRDGEIRRVRTVGRAETDANGELVALFGVFADITVEHERRAELERQVTLRTEALRRTNEDLESFAYAASHDLKEPLRMVANYVALLDRRFSERLDARGRRYIQHAVDGASRMGTLIDDLLAFSRVNRTEMIYEEVDFGAVVGQVAGGLAKRIKDKKATVERVGPDLEFSAVALVLRQVLQNLVSNALKYGGDHPRIQVSVAYDSSRSAHVVRVEDDGPGVPSEQRLRIFDPFVRLHGRDHSEGTGMGLAICRRLVERCGGRIWLDEDADGAAFCFSLPESVDASTSLSAPVLLPPRAPS